MDSLVYSGRECRTAFPPCRQAHLASPIFSLAILNDANSVINASSREAHFLNTVIIPCPNVAPNIPITVLPAIYSLAFILSNRNPWNLNPDLTLFNVLVWWAGLFSLFQPKETADLDSASYYLLRRSVDTCCLL